MRFQCLNSKGEVITIETPGHCHPEQTVCLFSPQFHTWMQVNRAGHLHLSWAKTFLNLPNAGNIPISIDTTTFMPMLHCFHDADKVLKSLTNPCVTDEVNPNLSPQSKLLLKFHFKLGHVGFQHLKWILRNFKFFGVSGVMASDKDTEIPLCSSCVTGGMQCKPVAPGHNKHTQSDKQRGVLKCEQMTPGQHIFF